MSLPFGAVDTTFERFLQELPEEAIVDGSTVLWIDPADRGVGLVVRAIKTTRNIPTGSVRYRT